MKAFYAFAIGIFAASLALGQAAAPPKVAFEVASIRPSQSSAPDRVNAGLRMDGSQAHFGSLSVKNLMDMAYRVQPAQISGPDWISSERFDISAKLLEGATTDQIPEMLQSLLADRFQLKIHHETKDEPAYVLTVGKSPLKLKEVPGDTAAPDPKGPVSVSASGSSAGVSIDLGNGSSFSLVPDEFDIKKINMDGFARQISRYLDRPVVNMTNLAGQYDVTLPLTQQDYYILLVRSGVNAGVAIPPQGLRLLDAGPPTSLFDALDQQGLHMDARKVPMDLIVVDQGLQTPTEN
jgi:uncharacterized protein (TIGR03435 family)